MADVKTLIDADEIDAALTRMGEEIARDYQNQDLLLVGVLKGAFMVMADLARKIDISQRDEIELMKDWLRQRQQPVPTDEQAHAMPMPGMLTAEQMAELAAARGREFERLFLTYMIRHHQGAPPR